MRIIKDLKQMKYWQAIILLSITLPITAYLLRQNNLKMVELSKVVVEIDESSGGDINEIEPALIELRDYVGSHMNTKMTAPIQLPYRYNSYVDAIFKEKEKTDSAYRRSVYQEAQEKCQAAQQYIRVPCIQEYVASQPGVEPIELPPVELFSYQFSSPNWSPDMAGFAVLVSLFFGFLSILLILNEIVIPLVVNMVKNDPLE